MGNRRSMIHVDDLVRAILLVADDRTNGEIFIATDGTPHSSREIYDAMCNIVGRSIPKWSLPKALFNIASLVSPRIKYKINKLLGDECYSSVKLEALGFKAKKTLKDILLPKAYFWIKHQYTIDIKQQHPISPMSYCNR